MQDLHTRLEELDRMETMICFSAEYLTEYDKQFNNRVCGGSNKGTRRYKMYFARIYTDDSKSNIPVELLEDWERTRLAILERAKRKVRKERLKIG